MQWWHHYWSPPSMPGALSDRGWNWCLIWGNRRKRLWNCVGCRKIPLPCQMSRYSVSHLPWEGQPTEERWARWQTLWARRLSTADKWTISMGPPTKLPPNMSLSPEAYNRLAACLGSIQLADCVQRQHFIGWRSAKAASHWADKQVRWPSGCNVHWLAGFSKNVGFRNHLWNVKYDSISPHWMRWYILWG